MTMGYVFRPVKSIVTRAPDRALSALVYAERFLNAVGTRRQLSNFFDIFVVN